MFHGRNNGKKLLAVRIVKHAFEIIHLLTDLNPIQVLVGMFCTLIVDFVSPMLSYAVACLIQMPSSRAALVKIPQGLVLLVP